MSQPFSSHEPRGIPFQGGASFPEQQTATDLNEAVQQAVHTLKLGSSGTLAIVRWERLPEAMGTSEQFATFFQLLFQTIVRDGITATRPFIYIKSERQPDDEIMDLSLPEGTTRYNLLVYSNITANESWLNAHREQIDAMKSILQAFQGSLECCTIENTGCLYVIGLAGKLF